MPTAAQPSPRHVASGNPVARAFQRCINADCKAEFPVDEVLVACKSCGQLLDAAYEWRRDAIPTLKTFEARSGTRGPRTAAGETPTTSMLDFSGVWRFRELLPFYSSEADIVTLGEGRTNLQRADLLARELGMDIDQGGRVMLQYEGFNPSGSFKDNGMTAGFTHARMVNATRVACASTGNTSAALAVYAALAGMKCFVFIGDGKIAYGKLSQALEYGATTLQVAGDFDACLARVKHIAEKMPEVGVYLMNSINPFRLEGQKTIMLRILEGLDWHVPDWILVPGGNLGNCSAFAKAFLELKALGLVTKVPRLAVIQAKGARTLDRVVNELGLKWTPNSNAPASGAASINPDLSGRYDHEAVAREYARMDAANERAKTVATAIEINRPVNLSKALRALWAMNGVVRSVDDAEIVEHKALVGKYGFGCEPASGASVAGVRMLRKEGLIKPTDTVACVLTGHLLKDPDVTVAYHTGLDTKAAAVDLSHAKPHGRISNPPIKVADNLDAILKAMGVR